MDRRQVLSLTITGTGLVVAGIVVVPSLISIFSPAFEARPASLWQAVAEVDRFKIGEMQKSLLSIASPARADELSQKAIYVWRRSADEFVVYSRSCTDLGCPLVWDAGSEWFFCPCHGGIFDKEGQRRAGPPKLPMWRYESRIENGVLEINLRSVPPMV